MLFELAVRRPRVHEYELRELEFELECECQCAFCFGIFNGSVNLANMAKNNLEKIEGIGIC